MAGDSGRVTVRVVWSRNLEGLWVIDWMLACSCCMSVCYSIVCV